MSKSPFHRQISAFEKSAQALSHQIVNRESPAEDVATRLRELAGEVREFGEEQEEKRSNMEERFPNGCPVMETLEARAGRCEEIADELDNVADRLTDEEPEPEECCCCGGSGMELIPCDKCPPEGEGVCMECNGTEEVEEECIECNGDGTVDSGELSTDQLEDICSDLDNIDWSVE